MKCNVTACNRDANALLVHRDNGKAYCPRCARKINEFAKPEVLIPWPSPHDIESGLDERRIANPVAFFEEVLDINPR